MSSWGPGIRENDAALDTEEDFNQTLGFSVSEGATADAAARRQAIEQQLNALMAVANQPTPLSDDLQGTERLMRCIRAKQALLSSTYRQELAQAADRVAKGDVPADGTHDLVPYYFRAVAFQVLAQLLMRFGCKVPAGHGQQLLDGMLNCEELAVALDTRNDYFAQDRTMPAPVRKKQLAFLQQRLRAVHKLHQEFSAHLQANSA